MAHTIDIRQVRTSPIKQGVDETITYILDTTNWTLTPATPSATFKKLNSSNTYDDVSGTHLTGSASVSGANITLPQVHSLVLGEQYRLEVSFTDSGNTFIAWAEIIPER